MKLDRFWWECIRGRSAGRLAGFRDGSDDCFAPFGAQILPGGGEGTVMLYEYGFRLQGT